MSRFVRETRGGHFSYHGFGEYFIARSLLVIAINNRGVGRRHHALMTAPNPDASPTPDEVQAKPPDEPSSAAPDA